jgi:hypothetical protein
MEKNEVREELRTTQPEQPTESFIEEAISQLAADLGVEVGELPNLGVYVSASPLESRYNTGISSDDRITIIWHHERPAAFSLETRNERNNITTQQVYLGPSIIDGT